MNKKGNYIQLNFSSMPKYINNFSNILKMDSNVLRFLVLINNYNFIKNILIKLFVLKKNYDIFKLVNISSVAQW
jgi:hypothetical protein